jgi:sarcosine/dimethylglycine N-methyltransferase
MTDRLDDVRDHYQADGLTERLKSALAALGSADQRLTPEQLGGLDQFHTRGLTATAELAELAEIAAGMSVLDIGAGVGGPARFSPRPMAVRSRASISASPSSKPRAI